MFLCDILTKLHIRRRLRPYMHLGIRPAADLAKANPASRTFHRIEPKMVGQFSSSYKFGSGLVGFTLGNSAGFGKSRFDTALVVTLALSLNFDVFRNCHNICVIFYVCVRANVLCLSFLRRALVQCRFYNSSVVLNLGSRDPLGVPNANLGGPKRKSGISTNFPQYK